MSNLVVGRIEFGERSLGALPVERRAFAPVISRQPEPYNDVAVETFGPIEKYIGLRREAVGFLAGLTPEQKEAAIAYRGDENHGQYIGLGREDRGPFIQVYPARQFFPFDPDPSEVFIESIAHGLSNICRYSGAVERHYSVAEHSTLIARYLAARHAPDVALAGLLHDAPESLSGFGDAGRPVKGRAPIIGETEDLIWRKAVSPRFGLPLDLPWEVHEADTRIIADEIAANLAPMDWQDQYGDPLGVRIRCWSADKAEIEFLATYDALTGGTGRRAA